MDTFAPFGWMHLIVTAISVVGWWLIVVLARRLTQVGREREFRWAFGLLILVVNLIWSFQFAVRAGGVTKDSLPLHGCDIAWMLATWSILSGGDPRRLRHQIVYYWGFGFSSFGYLTPSLQQGPATIFFWQFWTAHWLVLAAAIVNLMAFRVRPSWMGFWLTLVVTAAIVGPITLFNVTFDTTYFFTGRYKPSNPTPLDLLGPWPLRIVWMVLIAVAVFALMTLPAGIRRRSET